MLPRASKSSKLVGLLDALDALDGMDVATGVVTAKSGRELGFRGLEGARLRRGSGRRPRRPTRVRCKYRPMHTIRQMVALRPRERDFADPTLARGPRRRSDCQGRVGARRRAGREGSPAEMRVGARGRAGTSYADAFLNVSTCIPSGG